MKKLLLIISVVLLAYGCGVSCPPYTNIYSIDYSRYYNDDGFVVSSLSEFSGHPYIALGEIMVEHCEGIEYGDYIDKKNGQQMLDMLVKQAKSIGANGILAVKIRREKPFMTANDVAPYNWYASGVAVRFDNGSNFIGKKQHQQDRYDIQKAMTDAKEYGVPYIKFQTNESLFYDPQTENHIEVGSFIQKYGREAIERLQNLQRTQDIISRTVAYITSNKGARFESLDGRLFDIESGNYISEREYMKKYGQFVKEEIERQIEEKRLEIKVNKKANKNK